MKVSEESLSTVEKEGIYTGINAIHPITKNKIPIWIANYILAEYGTGSIMSVPAHDLRDYEFAKKYNLPINKVINSKESQDEQDVFTDDGILCNSENFSGKDSKEARKLILERLRKEKLGKQKVNFMNSKT